MSYYSRGCTDWSRKYQKGRLATSCGKGAGKVCLAKLRMASSTLLRPVQRIYPLEIYDEGLPVRTPASVEADRKGELTPTPREKENGVPSVVEVFTRGGRKVRPPPRFLI